MVIAGINGGPNLGDDVIYSGTVAAATEGRFLGFPAIAVSLAGEECRHYETAAQVVLDMVWKLQQRPLSSDTILNINVPDLPASRIAGVQATRLGNRHKSEPVVRDKNPQGEDVYWVGAPGAEQDAGPETDFHAIRHNLVSVTPLQVDLTRHATLQEIDAWLRTPMP